MNLSNRSIRNIFKAFLLFAILYNGYRYFFPWDRGGQSPSMPLYFSILKDVPWAIVVLCGFYGLYRKNKAPAEQMDIEWKYFNHWTVFFVITHVFLLVVAITHLSHKNPIDVFQRDIKNVQYIFLPFLFPLLINKEKDVSDYINWIIKLGIIVCMFGFSIYLFIPHFTWEGSVLSTFQSPICFGTFAVILFLISLSRAFIDKAVPLYWYATICVFYGSILISGSFAALISMIAGILFLLLISRPSYSALVRVCVLIGISSIVFFSLGFFKNHINKGNNLISTSTSLNGTTSYIDVQKNSFTFDTSSSWDFLKKPYEPKPDNSYLFTSQYTGISARKAYLEEIVTYLKTASIKDILWGDFSLKNHFEYDNVYFYFIKNDGIIVAVLLFTLLSSGILIGFKKFKKFNNCGDKKMASISLGITAALFILTIIQFNLSYFLNIYPINILTYFLLVLIVFINPSSEKNI